MALKEKPRKGDILRTPKEDRFRVERFGEGAWEDICYVTDLRRNEPSSFIWRFSGGRLNAYMTVDEER